VLKSEITVGDARSYPDGGDFVDDTLAWTALLKNESFASQASTLINTTSGQTVMSYGSAHEGSTLTCPSVFTLPPGCTATATGLQGGFLPQSGKTANRRPTRPWAERVIIFINLRLPQLGDPVPQQKHFCPTSSRSSSELDQLSSTKVAHNRGKKSSCLRNLDFPDLAKSGTGTGGLNSNDSGSGACPLTARSLCQHPCRKRRERASETKTPDACKLLQ
jgi:hypothetical protein